MKKRPNRPIDRSIFPAGDETQLLPTVLDTPERAVEFCKRNGLIKDGTAIDVKILIEKTPELSLEFRDIDPYDAYIEKLSDNNFNIVINSKHAETRQRFSMAHEYAHFQLHRDEIERMPKGEKILHRSEERNVVEYQANDYAANILMPESDFRQIARANEGAIKDIASAFKVSQLAVRYRAKNLGIRGHGL